MNKSLPTLADFLWGDSIAEKFSRLDGYYLLYPGENFPIANHLFFFNLSRIKSGDKRFLGFINDLSGADLPGGVSISSLDFLRKIKKGQRVGVVTFFSTSLEMFMYKHLLPHSYSFIAALYVNNECHTYLKVPEERDFVRINLHRYEEILDFFKDEISKEMLGARLKSIARLDLSPTINNYLPLEFEYFNNISESYSLKLRQVEKYVDVGASWGDCVQKFFGQVGDPEKSKAIAFEPNSLDFQRLNRLKYLLPLSPYKAFVSNSSDRVKFRTEFSNLHGSGLSENGELTLSVRLDDVVTDASFIKIDAEGAEPKILEGALNNLYNPQCNLAVCVYHYPQDLFDCTNIMKKIDRKNFFYRQYHPSLWDGIMYISD